MKILFALNPLILVAAVILGDIVSARALSSG